MLKGGHCGPGATSKLRWFSSEEVELLLLRTLDLCRCLVSSRMFISSRQEHLYYELSLINTFTVSVTETCSLRVVSRLIVCWLVRLDEEHCGRDTTWSRGPENLL